MNLNEYIYFQSDRGEFNSYIMDDLLEIFKTERSLSDKGSLCDNVVAKAT